MIATITSPATGSTHHLPKEAFNSNPPNRMVERYVQKSVCLESACMASAGNPGGKLALFSCQQGHDNDGQGGDHV